MSKTQSYGIAAVLIGAALMVLTAYVSTAPIDMSNAMTAGIIDLRTVGFLLGLVAFVSGTLFGLFGK